MSKRPKNLSEHLSRMRYFNGTIKVDGIVCMYRASSIFHKRLSAIDNYAFNLNEKLGIKEYE